MKLTLVRHAPIIGGYDCLSIYERNQITIGAIDPHADRGYIQDHCPIITPHQYYYTSSAQRAQDTGHTLLTYNNIQAPLITTQEMCEVHFSMLTYGSRDEVLAALISGSIPSPEQRIQTFIQNLDGDILCVSHAFIIRYCYYLYRKIPLEEAFCIPVDFLSIHVFDV